MVEKSEVERFRQFLDWASEEVASWPAWKRGILEASSKQFNEHARGEVVDTELMVFRCFTEVSDDRTKELMERVTVPDFVKTREDVREWLAAEGRTGFRYVVISAASWDVVRVKTLKTRTAEWAGKAYINEDGNGVL